MFIDRKNNKNHTPFGGAGVNWSRTSLDTFRSSERRRIGYRLASYKHFTPTE
jgi:hypothetical protein